MHFGNLSVCVLKVYFRHKLFFPLDEFGDYLQLKIHAFLAVCDKPCLNGGQCIAANTCACMYGFAGPQCQSGEHKTSTCNDYEKNQNKLGLGRELELF